MTIKTAPLRVNNLWQLLTQRAQIEPDAIFLIDAIDAKSMAVAEFMAAAESLAAQFYQRGIGAATVVAWQLPTATSTLLVAYALARLGAVQAPIIYQYREREVAEILRQSQPAFFITVNGLGSDRHLAAAELVLAEYDASLAKPQLIDLDDCGETAMDGVGMPDFVPEPDAVHWYYFTSGTTARPKGACHSDSSLIAGGYYLGQVLDVTASDVGSIGYPLAHIGGVVYSIMALAFGIPVVLLAQYTEALVVASFRRYGVTLGGGSTAHYQLLLEAQRKQPGQPLLPSLRLISGGGAAKPAALFAQVKAELGVNIVHAYGMTEAPITASNSPYDSDAILMHRDGIPMPSLHIKVVDAAGRSLPNGQSGEILLRGPNVCQGYLLAEHSDAAFDNEAYLHTGDIGMLCDDGHLQITGRLKDIIIRKGENISAREIEELLARHPAVKDVAVIGLPDVERGELVCAVVQLVSAEVPLSFAQMREFLEQQQLMRQKIPERLEIRTLLPRSESLQKVQKNILREQILAQL